MKKRWSILLTALVALVCASLLSACNKTPKGPAGTVSLDVSEMTLDLYERGTIVATVTVGGEPSDEEVTWASDNEAVATVAGGVVTPVAAGVANITASAAGAEATCVVTVADSGVVPTLTVTPAKLELEVGEPAVSVAASLFYNDADTSDAVYTYKVAETSIATVDAEGNVTAAGGGETTLTVSVAWRGFADTRTVPITVAQGYAIELTADALSLDKYQRGTLSATVTYNGEPSDEEVTWTIGDETVVAFENGIVTPLAEGTAEITAAVGYAKATCTVTVAFSGTDPALTVEPTELAFVIGDEAVTVEPTFAYLTEDTSDAEITWTIAETSVATVASGVVTPGTTAGNATLVVSVSWRGYTQSVNVPIVVKHGVSAQFENADELPEIYSWSGTVETEHTFAATATITAVVLQDGIDATEALQSKIVWHSEATEIASFTAGDGSATATLAAHEPGSVEIWYEVVDADVNGESETFRSKHLTIEVLYPTVDKTEEGSKFDFDKKAESNTVSATPDFFQNADGAVIEHIYAVTEDKADTETDLYTAEGNTVDVGAVPAGEQTFEFRTDKGYGYRVTVTVATMILKTAEDLKAFKALQTGAGSVSGSETTPYTVDGWYLLGADIAATDNTVLLGGGSWWLNFANDSDAQVLYDNGYGFVGTFDGRGHVLTGFEFGQGGLFGDLGKGALVKNLGITEAAFVEDFYVSAFANMMVGATVENCFVEVAVNRPAQSKSNLLNDNLDVRVKSHSAILVTYAGLGATIRNTVIVGEKGKTSADENVGMIASRVQAADQLTLDNVLLVATGAKDTQTFLVGGNANIDAQFDETLQVVDGSAADFAYRDYEFTADPFDTSKLGDEWTKTESKLPYFAAAPAPKDYSEAIEKGYLVDPSKGLNLAMFEGMNSSGTKSLVTSYYAGDKGGVNGTFFTFRTKTPAGEPEKYAGIIIDPLLTAEQLAAFKTVTKDDKTYDGADRVAMHLYVESNDESVTDIDDYVMFYRGARLADDSLEERFDDDNLANATNYRDGLSMKLGAWQTFYFRLDEILGAMENGRLNLYTLFEFQDVHDGDAKDYTFYVEYIRVDRAENWVENYDPAYDMSFKGVMEPDTVYPSNPYQMHYNIGGDAQGNPNPGKTIFYAKMTYDVGGKPTRWMFRHNIDQNQSTPSFLQIRCPIVLTKEQLTAAKNEGKTKVNGAFYLDTTGVSSRSRAFAALTTSAVMQSADFAAKDFNQWSSFQMDSMNRNAVAPYADEYDKYLAFNESTGDGLVCFWFRHVSGNANGNTWALGADGRADVYLYINSITIS